MPTDWSQFEVVEMPDGAKPPAVGDWSGFEVVDKPPQAWSDVGRRALGNIPPSSVDYGRNVLQAVTHPLDSATTAINAINGAAQQATGSSLGMDDHTRLAQAIAEYYANRYGGGENVKESVATDPVGVLADLSLPLTAGGGALKLAGTAGKIGRAGAVMSKAGQVMEPISLAGKVAHGVTLGQANRFLPGSLMESALKMKTALPPAERAQIVETLLKNRVAVTDKGAERIGAKVAALQNKVAPIIEKADAAGAVIDPYDVVLRLDDVYPRYDTVTRRASQAPISRVGESFVAENTREVAPGVRASVPLTPSQAQAKKINTYRENSGAYESTSRTSAEKDALKALARGLKEEIERVAPGVSPVNAELSQLIPAQEWVNRALGRSGNWNPIGMGGLMGVASGNLPAAVALEMSRMPGFLSRAAITGDILRRYGSPLVPNAGTRAAAGGLLSATEDFAE